jgi:hypothetical protein
MRGHVDDVITRALRAQESDTMVTVPGGQGQSADTNGMFSSSTCNGVGFSYISHRTVTNDMNYDASCTLTQLTVSDLKMSLQRLNLANSVSPNFYYIFLTWWFSRRGFAYSVKNFLDPYTRELFSTIHKLLSFQGRSVLWILQTFYDLRKNRTAKVCPWQTR